MPLGRNSAPNVALLLRFFEVDAPVDMPAVFGAKQMKVIAGRHLGAGQRRKKTIIQRLHAPSTCTFQQHMVKYDGREDPGRHGTEQTRDLKASRPAATTRTPIRADTNSTNQS